MLLRLVGGLVWQRTGSLEGAELVIDDDGYIVDAGDCMRCETEEVLDVHGAAVLPGLIDTHVHISHDPRHVTRDATVQASYLATILGVTHLRRTLASGFTTVRSLGGLAHVDIALAKAQKQGDIVGSRLIAAGQAVCITGGHGWATEREADGVEGVRLAVREQLKEGAGVIKVISTGGILTDGVEPGSPQLSLAETQAAVEEAHNAGRKVAAHAQGRRGIEIALEAGVDSIEHGIYLDAVLSRRMVERSVFLCPTLSGATRLLEHAADVPEIGYAIEKAKRAAADRKANVMLALKSGVKLAFGTDAGTPFNFHGDNAGEFALLREYDVSMRECIWAATSSAAECIGWGDRIGSLEPGFLADIAVFKGNPLVDPRCLERPPELVLQSGRVVAKSGAVMGAA